MNRVPRMTAGFTLIELILVMTILTVMGLLAALAIPNIKDAANIRATEATMRLIDVALDKYREDKGTYPTGTGETMVYTLTSTSGGWTRASLQTWFPKRKDVKDAWENLFYYTSATEYDSSGRGVERTPGKKDFYNSKRYQLYSMGPNMATWPNTKAGGNDRLCGTEPDDIRNQGWVQETFYTSKPAGY